MDQNMRFCVECGHEVASAAQLPRSAAPTIPTLQTQVRPSDAFPIEVGRHDSSISGLAPANRKAIIIASAIGGALVFLIVCGVATLFMFERTNRTEIVNQSAVIAETTPPVSTPQPATQLPQKPTLSQGANLDSSTSRDEVLGVLNGWAAAVGAHDLEQHLSYYADVLDVYYRKQNVGINYVRSSRRPAFVRFRTLDVQLSKIVVNIDASGSYATATFDKTYRFEGDKTLSGSVQQRIALTKIVSRWRITGEQDLQIYYIGK